jgi:hypothetical protein
MHARLGRVLARVAHLTRANFAKEPSLDARAGPAAAESRAGLLFGAAVRVDAVDAAAGSAVAKCSAEASAAGGSGENAGGGDPAPQAPRACATIAAAAARTALRLLTNVSSMAPDLVQSFH